MLLNTPEFKVGVLVVVVSALIGGMSLKVAEGPSVLTGSKRYWFDVEDAGGLVKNSAVKMAGIKVGIIEDIELVDGQARVHLLVEDEVPMTLSGAVELRADGILGDKHVELIAGKVGDPPLDSGRIANATSKGSLDKVMEEVGDIAASLKEVAAVLEDAAKDGSRATTIGRILSNIETLTQDLADMSSTNKGKVNEIVDQVHDITDTLDELINDDSPEGFKAAWRDAMSGLKRLDKTMENAEEISQKINDGEGTIGRLVNDEDTIDGINQAITNVNEFLGGASAMETSIDFHSEYIGELDGTKSYLNVKIQPGLDRYYLLGIVDDPNGVTRETTTTTSTDGAADVVVEEKRQRKSEIKFTAQFAKNFWDFTLRGGIMENTGGVGFDYYLFRKRLVLSMEAFDFEDLNLRMFARYNILKGVYVIGGGHDITDSDNASGFIGGGIFITNDDLKTLASSFSF